MTERTMLIQAEWDPEAEVWVASSDDVPGLATEADTLEALEDKLRVMVPELLELNGHLGQWPADAAVNLIATKRERLALHG